MTGGAVDYRVGIRWVEVDGVACDVECFREVPPPKRPPMICLACRQPVTAKLGEIVAPHAAHLPDATCSVSSGESALHFNVKMALAQRLREIGVVYILRQCEDADRHGCSESPTIDEWYAPRWDRVEVEYAAHTLRPDIALLADNRVVGAVEVLVSHAVDAKKSAVFDAQKLAWIEVPAVRWLWSMPSGTAQSPLPVTKAAPGNEWRCLKHFNARLPGARARGR